MLSPRRPTAALLSIGLLVVGLWGMYRYWESYYQHRGFTPVAYLPNAHRGRLLTVHFYSPALRREADYIVYLPAEYLHGSRRFPVYYLLHGSPGRPEVFLGIANMPVRMDDLVAEHRMKPMILVFPDGRIGGSTMSDSEWADTPSGDYAGYVLNVVSDVDTRFRAIDNRQDRVIAGFSMGAYGATNIALHNLALFAGLQSWSGYYIETRSGVFANASRATLDANSPLRYVGFLRAQLRVDPLRAFLFIGRDDDLSPQTEPMATALAAAGGVVSYALYHGGHDWELWHAHLDQMLEMAWRDTVRPVGPSTGTARTLTPGVVPIPNGAGRRHRHGRRRRVAARDARARHDRPARRPRRGRRGRRRHGPAAVNLVLTRFVIHHRRPGGGAHGLVGGRRAARGRTPGRGRIAPATLLGGLLLSLVSAMLINIGFLLQHRGLRGLRSRGPGAIAAALRDRTWLAGQALGWVGFGAQIAAVALAPLALVQAFAAGGLALSIPPAVHFCGQRIDRAQRMAVVLIAVGLAALPIGFSTAEDRLSTSALIALVAGLGTLGAVAGRLGWAGSRALAAGLFYGVADAAIKAVSVNWHTGGAGALLSGWTLVAAAGTFAGFLSFQAALTGDGPVAAISAMNALAALVALACGLAAFGESLGGGAGAALGHGLAIAAVLCALPVLAAAQTEIVEPRPQRDERAPMPAAPALAAGQRSG